MKFKVGDIIKGTNDAKYSITNKDMYAARVLELYKSGNIRIRILDHLNRDNVGDTYIVNPKHFVYKDNDSKDNNLYKNNLGTNSIVEIIEAPYGAKGVNKRYGLLVDSHTGNHLLKTEKFKHNGLNETSKYFFIPFNNFYKTTEEEKGEIWGLGDNFTEIEFKDIITGIIYNKPKKMTIEEIEKELGYKFEIVEEN